MADRIDTLMQAMQPPLSHAFGDRRPTETRREQLPMRDPPMLALGDPRDLHVRGAFVRHSRTKEPHAQVLPDERQQAHAANLIR